MRPHANPTKFAIQRAKELRQSMTPSEHVLWTHLRNRRLGGFKFRRQHPVGPFIVDFYCAEARLVIEVDGDIHAFQQERDALREKWLLEQQLRVLRFTNRSVEPDVKSVLLAIETACLSPDQDSLYENRPD